MPGRAGKDHCGPGEPCCQGVAERSEEVGCLDAEAEHLGTRHTAGSVARRSCCSGLKPREGLVSSRDHQAVLEDQVGRRDAR